MDLLQQKRGLDLLYDLFIRGKGDVLRIPYTPSKTAMPEPVADYFPRATPESCGIESDRLRRLLQALEDDRGVNMHAITVLCDGAVICEATAPAYDRSLPHVTYSMCKSIVGLAIGFLYDEGRIDLDKPAYRYFSQADLPRLSGRMKNVTVRHLLSMSSGVSFAETGLATDTDWVRAFFSADLKFDPGSDFAYNSMNTYILSALVRSITGEGLVDFLRPRLFEPLHIRHVFWERCPRGIEKGGWGLYIAQEDMAKIGLMCLSLGTFEGKRILSEEWIREATQTKRIVPEEAGNYNYAYQIWRSRDERSYLFNGMLGQNTWIYPQKRLIVVLNAGNIEFFQQSAMLDLIEEYLGQEDVRAAIPLKPNKKALRALHVAEENFYAGRAWVKPLPQPSRLTRLWRRLRRQVPLPLPATCEELAGRQFTWQKNNSGILPLLVRLQQNNHTKGLRSLSFERQGERFFACFDEGEDTVYRVEFGFYDYRRACLTVGGESYRIACAARFTVDEEGRRLLMLHMVFPEMAHDRRIKLYYEGEQACLRLRETPGKETLSCLVRGMSVSAPRSRGIFSFISSRLNLDYFLIKAYDKFEPLLLSERAGERLSQAEPPLPDEGEEPLS